MGHFTPHALGANVLLVICRTTYERKTRDLLCYNAYLHLNLIDEEGKFYAKTVSWHHQQGHMQNVLHKAVLITNNTIFG